jgi:diguanylate cyclase (GGDEF)-like protein
VSLKSALVFSPDGRPLPYAVLEWLAARGVQSKGFTDPDELVRVTLRGQPRLAVIDARHHGEAALALCRRLKGDSFTGIVPVAIVTAPEASALAAAFEAGADEVLRDDVLPFEVGLRLNALLRRSDRDTDVHPSTRLPGAAEIEQEMTRRIESGTRFAVCYADLDHFKEFNDRYSYFDGDRVIRILARILHDVVKGVCGADGFVGHIGGDDFIFIIPTSRVVETCGTVVEVFDTLVPFQYTEQDVRAGYYFGKDRRGQLHKVPLMTLSVGVVTNERRTFTHAGRVSELATEMKSYAKSLQGSVFAVDRRSDTPSRVPAVLNQRSARMGEGR